MNNDIEYIFETTGEKLTIFSLEINGVNFFQDLLDNADEDLLNKINYKIKIISDMGINVSNSHFKKITQNPYKDNYYVKIISPSSIRISATTFHFNGAIVILLFDWGKKEDWGKRSKKQLDRAQKIINEIHGDPYETKKKLEAAIKRK